MTMIFLKKSILKSILNQFIVNKILSGCGCVLASISANFSPIFKTFFSSESLWKRAFKNKPRPWSRWSRCFRRPCIKSFILEILKNFKPFCLQNLVLVKLYEDHATFQINMPRNSNFDLRLGCLDFIRM